MISASDGRMDRKSRRSVSCAISPSAPANSTPVGPAPTITNLSHSRRFSGIALAFSRLERIEKFVTDLRRRLDGLQPRRGLLPVAVPEIVVPGACGDNQRIVTELHRPQESRAFGPHPGPPPRPAAPRYSSAGGKQLATATRSHQVTANQSPPGTAAAERDGSCAGREE